MKRILLTALLLPFALPAAAQEPPPFSDADTDKNGLVSMEEAKVAMPDMTTEAWTTADADTSDDLTEEEYAVMIKSGM